jgi:hypothetical protein
VSKEKLMLANQPNKATFGSIFGESFTLLQVSIIRLQHFFLKLCEHAKSVERKKKGKKENFPSIPAPLLLYFLPIKKKPFFPTIHKRSLCI